MQKNDKKKIYASTDVVVTINRQKIVLIKRVHPPFQDKLVLPGGFFEPDVDRDVLESCVREAGEEINLRAHFNRFELLTVLSKQGRDPRPWGPRISVVYWVDITKGEAKNLHAGDDAKEIVIRDLDSLTPDEIGFDHWNAILELRGRLEELEAE